MRLSFGNVIWEQLFFILQLYRLYLYFVESRLLCMDYYYFQSF